jgi:hypothetical protein
MRYQVQYFTETFQFISLSSALEYIEDLLAEGADQELISIQTIDVGA